MLQTKTATKKTIPMKPALRKQLDRAAAYHEKFILEEEYREFRKSVGAMAAKAVRKSPK